MRTCDEKKKDKEKIGIDRCRVIVESKVMMKMQAKKTQRVF